uniref:Uncharacterized protein n=1 Tax=Anguilla anguilla TaxID=7936 RepID=A0A0E9PIR4_ANGAN
MELFFQSHLFEAMSITDLADLERGIHRLIIYLNRFQKKTSTKG